MSKGGGEILIAIGSALIVAGFFGKAFYGSNRNFGVSDKPMPTWLGRIIFWVVGGMMIAGGLNALFPPH
jgi:hypothetical protein